MNSGPTKLFIAFGIALICLAAYPRSQEHRLPEADPASKPKPHFENVRYGPFERNVMDLWRAVSDAPIPVVIYFHGGGFRQGDKSSLTAGFLEGCLKSGIPVAAANYRLSHQASFPAPMLDGARAIQFLRLKAQEWNLDPQRIGARGGSAGAGISLWVGFHDDLADPVHDDPVARQSTRLACIAVANAQSSYDLRFIKSRIGGRAYEHPALPLFYGLKPEELDTPRAYELYEEASPINYVSAGDPPTFLSYEEPFGTLPADAKPGEGIHHPHFGIALKEKLDALGIECVMKHVDQYRAIYGELNVEKVRGCIACTTPTSMSQTRWVCARRAMVLVFP